MYSCAKIYYNIPSNNRELQPMFQVPSAAAHYNIPSNNRELQLAERNTHTDEIITYQVITGNYNAVQRPVFHFAIITYQVITGNYNRIPTQQKKKKIITYQVITGNYNVGSCHAVDFLYYNIPSNNRELQLTTTAGRSACYYNIPSNNWELQQGK